MSAKTGGTGGDSDQDVERFLKRWMPLVDDYEGCPPYSVLAAVAKEPHDSAQQTLESLSRSAKQPDWPGHVESCLHCKNMISLLQETERPKVTMEQIFAKASREAQEVRSKGRSAARARIPSFTWSLNSSSLFDTRPRSLMAFSTAIVLVAVFWVAAKQYNFFRTPGDVATVSFEKNEPKEFRQSVEAKLAELDQTDIKIQEEKDYVADYIKKADQITLLKQKNLSSDDRTAIAVLMARYHAKLEEEIGENHNTRTNPVRPTPNSPSIQSETDTAVVISLFNNVEQALSNSKKNENEPTPTVQIPKSDAIEVLSRELKLDFDDPDVAVSIQDRSTNRSYKEASALMQGVQSYANQNGRNVNLRTGMGNITITPGGPR